MHHVKAGETLYSIAQAYQVTVEDIERLNPEVADGLKAEQVIGIPVVFIQEDVVQNTENESDKVVTGGKYVVLEGEDLYDIAKKFGIDVGEFKALNPGLDNEPKPGTVIKVPDIVNTDDYLVHKVEYNERTTSLLKRWKVSESEFRNINISVGSHVFVNQMPNEVCVCFKNNLAKTVSDAYGGRWGRDGADGRPHYVPSGRTVVRSPSG